MKVKGSGNPNAKIVIVGECPAKQEVINGEPFIGPAGSLLRNLMRDVGIDPDECYFDNVFQERPPDDDVSYFFSSFSKMELKPEYSLDDFHNRISKLNPNVIVAAGKVALWALTGKTQISRYRGSILESDYGKVIPIFHPSHVMRQFDTEGLGDLLFITYCDLRKIKEQSEFPEIKLPKRHFTYKLTLKSQLEYLDSLLDQEEFSFDIETYKHLMICIGFATSPSEAACIPFKDTRGWIHDIKNQVKLIDKLCEIMESKSGKIGQNLLYDCAMLRRLFAIHVNNVTFDTMIGWHILYPEFRKGLDFLASIFTNERYWKDDGKTWSKVYDYPRLWQYNCLDCAITLEISYPIRKMLTEQGLWGVYYDYHNAAFGPILNATLRGMKLDLAYVEQYRKLAEEKFKALSEELAKLVGPVNVNSPKQVADLIYNKLKYPPRYKDGKLRVDEDALLALNSARPHRALQLIIQLRKLHKHISTYLKMKFDPFTLRFHANFNPSGTVTGRLSSDKAPWGVGANIQNIPRPDTEKKITGGL